MKDSASVREQNPKLAEIPFNSSNKYQASVHRIDNGFKFLVVMKGAPEIVFSRCSTILLGGINVKSDSMMEERFLKANQELGEGGERVLAFCDRLLDSSVYPPSFQFDIDSPAHAFPIEGLRYNLHTFMVADRIKSGNCIHIF